MKKAYLKAATATAIVVIMLFALIPFSQAQGKEHKISFQLLNHPDGDLTYELNVTISHLLYEYYAAKSHRLVWDSDFAKFITPYTLRPIADRLWEIYDNEEDFTNGVLMLVHQLTYEETIPGKYPVETLVEGKGDCDLFAFIAASLLKAGGIKSVLLYYKTQSHMQLGVQLANSPESARNGVYYVEYQGTKYYIAESTGGKWREGWRVGECPTDYRNASSQVITFQNSEQISIGQVSATLEELEPSTLELEVPTSLLLENTELLIRGKILQEVPYQNVTLYAKINSESWTTLGTAETQADGQFEYLWKPTTGGFVTIQAGWSGDRQYNGAMSTEASLIVLPLLVLIALVSSLSAIAVSISAVLFLRSKRQQEPLASHLTGNTANW